jgi:hypothetical protein
MQYIARRTLGAATEDRNSRVWQYRCHNTFQQDVTEVTSTFRQYIASTFRHYLIAVASTFRQHIIGVASNSTAESTGDYNVQGQKYCRKYW